MSVETLIDELSGALLEHLRRTLDHRTLLASAEADRAVDADRWAAVFEQGLGDIALPASADGFDLDASELAQLMVAGGRGSLPAAAREQAVTLGPVLAALSEDQWCQQMLGPVRTGAGIGGGGGTVDGSTMQLREGVLRIERQPVWLGRGASVVAVVGPTLAAVVDLAQPSVCLEPVPAIDPGQGLHNLTATVERVLVGDAARHIWRRWQLALLADVQGSAEEMLERSVRHASEREQFGRPIASFQAVAHRLADMHVGVTAGLSVLSRAAALVAEGHRDSDAAIAAAACWLPDRARDVCEQAIQVHGGTGFTWELGLHLHYRRALAVQATLGGRRGAAVRAAEASDVWP